MEKNSPTVLLAAIYIRVSTLEQAEDGYSLAAQERTLRDYCKIKGYEVYDIYADEGRSGKDIRGRPEMQRLVKDGIDEKFDIVLVWKLTRFTRTLSDLCATCNILEKHGAYLESYSEAFDSKTTVGRLIRGILGAVAQWEREVIAENVIAAMEERARQGKRTCNEVLGYDLDGSDSLIINAQEAEVVQYIFDRYLEYRNLSAVAELCRLKGYRGKRGRVFNAWSIRLILTRPIYAGYNSYNGKIFFGQHEPIGKGIQAILPTVKSAINFFAQKVLPVVQRVVGFITGTILPKMVSYFQTNIPKIGQIISNVWSVAKPILSFFADGISAIWSVAQPVISYLAGAFSGLGTGIMSTLSGITGFISGIFTGNWAKAWDGVKQIFRGFAEALIGIFKTPINAIIGLINKAIQGINSLHIDIPDWVPGLGGKTFGINIPEIPLLAKGGIATAPTLSVVGEGREKEAILPLSKLDGMLSQQAQGVVQTVNIAPVMALLKRFLDRPQQPAQQVQYVFAPQIAGGGREKEEIREMLRDEYPEFCRMMDRYEKDRRRKPLNPGR